MDETLLTLVFLGKNELGLAKVHIAPISSYIVRIYIYMQYADVDGRTLQRDTYSVHLSISAGKHHAGTQHFEGTHSKRTEIFPYLVVRT